MTLNNLLYTLNCQLILMLRHKKEWNQYNNGNKLVIFESWINYKVTIYPIQLRSMYLTSNKGWEDYIVVKLRDLTKSFDLRYALSLLSYNTLILNKKKLSHSLGTKDKEGTMSFHYSKIIKT